MFTLQKTSFSLVTSQKFKKNIHLSAVVHNIVCKHLKKEIQLKVASFTGQNKISFKKASK